MSYRFFLNLYSVTITISEGIPRGMKIAGERPYLQRIVPFLNELILFSFIRNATVASGTLGLLGMCLDAVTNEPSLKWTMKSCPTFYPNSCRKILCCGRGEL